MNRVELLGLDPAQSPHCEAGNNEAGRFQPAEYLADVMPHDGIGLDQQERLVRVQGSDEKRF